MFRVRGWDLLQGSVGFRSFGYNSSSGFYKPKPCGLFSGSSEELGRLLLDVRSGFCLWILGVFVRVCISLEFPSGCNLEAAENRLLL